MKFAKHAMAVVLLTCSLIIWENRYPSPAQTAEGVEKVMTDREYLDEAREWLEKIKKLAGLAKDEKMYQKRLKTLEWLIEQAEKADRYESVLEFYADEENHEYDVTYEMADVIESRVMEDNGELARKALGYKK